MSKLNSWSRYIIRKGFFLAAMLLISSLIMLVWQSATPSTFPLLGRFALYNQTSSAIVLAATSLGSLFLEDIVRNG